MTLPSPAELNDRANTALRDILGEAIGPHVRWGSEGAPLVIERIAERIAREFGVRCAIATALEINLHFAETVKGLWSDMESLHAQGFPEQDIPAPDVADMNQQLELPDELEFHEPQHFTLEVQDGSLGSEDSFS